MIKCSLRGGMNIIMEEECLGIGTDDTRIKAMMLLAFDLKILLGVRHNSGLRNEGKLVRVVIAEGGSSSREQSLAYGSLSF